MKLGYRFTILTIVLGAVALMFPALLGQYNILNYIPTILFWGLSLVYAMISMTSEKEKQWNEDAKWRKRNERN